MQKLWQYFVRNVVHLRRSRFQIENWKFHQSWIFHCIVVWKVKNVWKTALVFSLDNFYYCFVTPVFETTLSKWTEIMSCDAYLCIEGWPSSCGKHFNNMCRIESRFFFFQQIFALLHKTNVKNIGSIGLRMVCVLRTGGSQNVQCTYLENNIVNSSSFLNYRVRLLYTYFLITIKFYQSGGSKVKKYFYWTLYNVLE